MSPIPADTPARPTPHLVVRWYHFVVLLPFSPQNDGLAGPRAEDQKEMLGLHMECGKAESCGKATRYTLQGLLGVTGWHHLFSLPPTVDIHHHSRQADTLTRLARGAPY